MLIRKNSKAVTMFSMLALVASSTTLLAQEGISFQLEPHRIRALPGQSVWAKYSMCNTSNQLGELQGQCERKLLIKKADEDKWKAVSTNCCGTWAAPPVNPCTISLHPGECKTDIYCFDVIIEPEISHLFDSPGTVQIKIQWANHETNVMEVIVQDLQKKEAKVWQEMHKDEGVLLTLAESQWGQCSWRIKKDSLKKAKKVARKYYNTYYGQYLEVELTINELLWTESLERRRKKIGPEEDILGYENKEVLTKRLETWVRKGSLAFPDLRLLVDIQYNAMHEEVSGTRKEAYKIMASRSPFIRNTLFAEKKYIEAGGDYHSFTPQAIPKDL
jgi:hypothetical protein